MTANPPRDAWSALRGSYYQIQLTVQRWLELKPDDHLFCERGEDIEIISGALGGAPTPEQLLEQVKIRKAISLRSPEAVSALIRLFEVRQRGGIRHYFGLRRSRVRLFPFGTGWKDEPRGNPSVLWSLLQ